MTTRHTHCTPGRAVLADLWPRRAIHLHLKPQPPADSENISLPRRLSRRLLVADRSYSPNLSTMAATNLRRPLRRKPEAGRSMPIGVSTSEGHGLNTKMVGVLPSVMDPRRSGAGLSDRVVTAQKHKGRNGTNSFGYVRGLGTSFIHSRDILREAGIGRLQRSIICAVGLGETTASL